MNPDQVCEYIQSVWARTPPPARASTSLGGSIAGIQRQIDSGTTLIFYLIQENEMITTIKSIRITK